MSQSNSNIPPRMTALGLLEQMRRSNAANREPEFNPISAMRRAGPTAPLFGGQRQPPLPIPPRPPAVIPPPPPQQAAPQAAVAPQARTPAQALPVPPRPPQLGADGNPIPPAVLPQVPGAEPQPLYARFNPENPYVATATQMAERYGLPPNVLLSLLHRESGFNPTAVSRAGALGIGQLMPGTARDLGVDPMNPEQNIEGSARYLRQQLDRFGGDMTLALAAYNAGPRRVAEAGNTIPNNAETRAYVPGVMRNAGVPGYAMGGLAHLEQKYAEGGAATSLPTYDSDVRATRIPRRRVPRPAPREELTADQLNGMVLDILARRAAAEPEAGAAAEARERIGRTMGYAEGGLADLHQRYAEGGRVMSDEEYDRRLLERMKRDTGRTTESTNAEQARALRSAGYDAAQLASDIFMPQSPLDAALMVALGPGGRMARLAGSTALMAMEPSEAEAGGLRRLIRAYHGSPHEFDRFDFSRVGTGHGAQNVGAGGYFAGAKNVAESFKPPGGYMYEVQLNTEPSKLLDWNAPFREQSIFETLNLITPKEVGIRQYRNRAGQYEYVTPEDLVISRTDTPVQSVADLLGANTGEDAYRRLSAGLGWRQEGDQRASEFLRRYGVDGIRYNDMGKISGGDITSNYVIFDPDIIDITRRYAQGGLAQLEHKYAEGGAVSAQPAIYDPDAVNALANQIEADYV